MQPVKLKIIAFLLISLFIFSCGDCPDCPKPNCKDCPTQEDDREVRDGVAVDNQGGEYEANSRILYFPPNITDAEIAKFTFENKKLGHTLTDSCACDYLQLWGKSPGIDMYKSKEGADDVSEGAQGGEFKGRNYFLLPIIFPFGDQGGDTISNSPGTNGSIKVAVVDTGIDDDLRNFFYDSKIPNDPCQPDQGEGYNYDGNNFITADSFGHGTPVASIIADAENPTYGINLLNLKIQNTGEGKLFDALCGLKHAVDVKEIKVINLSWGYQGEKNWPLEALVLEALKKDQLVVASAGNDTTNVNDTNYWPACINFDNMITVGAFDSSNDQLSDFSNYGHAYVDIVAEGTTNVFYKGIRRNYKGTSFSAPLVSHVAAAVRIERPTASYLDTREIILNSAINKKSLVGKIAGGRLLNKQGAIDLAKQNLFQFKESIQ